MTCAGGHAQLDPATHRVSADADQVHLGPTEFRLLHFS
jgi:DNA-binding response OmpR family regulator